jgi:hypothetical protein
MIFFCGIAPKIFQTIISDYSTRVKRENCLTLIRLSYDYFLTEYPDLHAVNIIEGEWHVRFDGIIMPYYLTSLCFILTNKVHVQNTL